MSKMLRQVGLPPSLLGELYLSGMPGRYRSLAEDLAEAEATHVTRLVCLAPSDEILRKSPEYAEALEAGSLPWDVDAYPIGDFGVPDNRNAFLPFVGHLADHLRSGERLLIHCGAGKGRTGMVAICVLMAVGFSREDAADAVTKADSSPETPEQRDLVQWFAKVSATR